MQSQLKDSPFPVFRQEAVHADALKDHCPDIVKNKTDNKAWASIFCSNRKVFEKALNNPDKPKYIMVFEDDVVLEPGFFSELRQFLQNDCIDQNPWDVMAVDTFRTWWTSEIEQKAELKKKSFKGCTSKDEPRQVHYANKYWYGAHAQIIKTSSLEQMMKRKVHAQDTWLAFKNETTLFWQPKLVRQIRKNFVRKGGQLPAECDASIQQNDHPRHGSKEIRTFITKDSEKGMFTCPSSPSKSNAGLKVSSKADLVPKVAAGRQTGGSDIIYQKPQGEIKGIFLYLHGCNGYMTDMFTEYGPDGFKLDICQNKTGGKHSKYGYDSPLNRKFHCKQHADDILMRQQARERGYLVASPQGTHKDRCTSQNQANEIARAVEWIKKQENLVNLPVIVAGMSAGGGAVPKVAVKVRGSCSVLVASSSHLGGSPGRSTGFDADFWKSPTPVLYIHHPEALEGSDIQSNIKDLKKNNVANAEIKVSSASLDPEVMKKEKHSNYLAMYAHEAIDFCEKEIIPEA
jgi:GR25 family glycosyltransferase involved in LPS biosynthesis